MTVPRQPRRFDEPPPAIEVEPLLRTGAGVPVTTRVRVVNRSPEPRFFVLTPLGLDADWLPGPARSAVVLPGNEVLATLTFTPAAGTTPARYPFAVAVQALDPASQTPTAAVAVSEVVLAVDSPGQISVILRPALTRAVRSKRVVVELHNAGTTPERVDLEARTPRSTSLQLGETSVVVPPGQSATVRSRLRVRRPAAFGRQERHVYTVTAHTTGASRYAEGAITSRPVFGRFGARTVAFVAVIAVWAALAALFIPKLSNTIRHQADGPSASAPGAADGGGSDGGSASGGGSGSDGGSGGGAGGAGGSGRPVTVQFNGTVGGNAPSGVIVGLRPTSLVDEQAQGATELGFRTDTGSVGKVTELAAFTRRQQSPVSSARSTRTDSDGAWAFPKIKSPGYYLLTFSKAGYQTQRYVVDSSSAVAAEPLKITLSPGTGHLRGTVTGPKGAVGGAEVTLSDGTNTITTSSDSRGHVGRWSVDGLSTPDSYLVSVGKNGYGTQSRLVDLSAGGSSSINLRLHAGVTELTGKVGGSDVTAGLGGVQITASDGTVSRTAATVTSGPDQGRYMLPNLPPGRYAVTMSAPGYLDQTRRMTISDGETLATADATLTSSSSVIIGKVSSSTGAGVDGAGMILSSSAATYKTTSDEYGNFQFSGVAPGRYVLSGEYFGMITSYVSVLAAVGVATPSVSMTLDPVVTHNTSTIAGTVSSAINPNGTLLCLQPVTEAQKALGCNVQLTLRNSDGDIVQTHLDVADPFADSPLQAPEKDGPTGYTLASADGLEPGIYHVTASAAGYLTGSVTVRVPFNGVATAPTLALYPTNTITGTITALGDIATDGPAAPAGGYTSCVYAVPVGSPVPDTSNCAQPTQTGSCEAQGQPDYGYSLIDESAGDTKNSYTIRGLCDGSYNVYVITTNPWYVSITPTASQTVIHGQTITYSPHVFRKGRIVLVVKKAGDDGSVTLVTNTSVSVDCGGAAAAATYTTDDAGSITISGVTAGTVSCGVSIPNATPALSGSVNNVTVANDTDANGVVVLTSAVGITYEQLVGTVIKQVPYPTSTSTTTRPEPADGGLANVQLTITGTTGYNGDTPVLGTTTLTTDADGCFALAPDKNTVPVRNGTGDCTTAVSSSAVGVLQLASPRVTVSAKTVDSNNQPFTESVTLQPEPALNKVQVAPVPGTLNPAFVLSSSDGKAQLADAQITVTKQPDGAGTVTVTPGFDGKLKWNDTNLQDQGTNKIWPGDYTLVASLAGYQNATVNFTCQPNATCPANDANGKPPTFQLSAQPYVSGTITGHLGPDPTGSNPSVTSVSEAIDNASVTAESCTGSSAASCKSQAGDPTTRTVKGAYSVQLSPGYYLLNVAAPGYQSGQIGPFQVQTADVTGKDTTLQIVLIDTTVQVTASNGGVSGAEVSLVSTSSQATVDATTDSSGKVEFDGGTGASHGPGPLVPGSYTYTVSGSGIRQLSGSVQVLRSTGTTSPDNATVTLGVSEVASTISGTVTDAAGNPVSGLPVSLTPSAGTATYTSPATDSGGHFSFTPSAPAGTYTLKVNQGTGSNSNYGTATRTVTIDASSPPTTDVGTIQLSKQSRQVAVTVTAPSGDDISGATNPLLETSGTSLSPGAVTHSGAQFVYTFNQVPTGGCWTFSLDLPANHFGSLGNPSPAGSGCTGSQFSVPAGSSTLAIGYTLTEARLQAKLFMKSLDADTRAVPSATISVSGTSPAYSTTVSTLVKGTNTVPLDVWAGTEAAHTVSVTLTTTAGWPTAAKTDKASGTSSTADVGTFTEAGATLRVAVTQGGKDLPDGTTATVSLHTPSGVTAPADGSATNSGNAEFDNVPYADGYTLTATIGTKSTTTDPFTVSSPTPPTKTIDVPN